MRKLHPYLDILVSNIGEVFIPATRGYRAHWTFGYKRPDGYRKVVIDGKGYLVHRLVAETFLGKIHEGYQIDHANRVRDDNRVENIRICTPSDNCRNTAQHDRVTERGGTHFYEDARQAHREKNARYRAEHPEKGREYGARYRAKHPEKGREYQAQYNQAKRKTHRQVQFSDGSRHWLPLPEADAYLIIPLKERFYHAK